MVELEQHPTEEHRQVINQQRWEMLDHIDDLIERPMTFLSFVWLGLVVLDLTRGLTGFLLILNYVIWALFVLHFLIEFVIAPHKVTYLRRHWLTAIALVLPAFRVIRVLTAVRLLRTVLAVRPLVVARVIAAVNRGLAALNYTVGKRGVGYVLGLTTIVTFVGAAGMLYYESPASLRAAGLPQVASSGAGLHSYGEAVWWTVMIMTTMGSAYWPYTPEGRILCAILAIYAFSVFGYITATIASYFVGGDNDDHAAKAAAAFERQAAAQATETVALREEIHALREQLSTLTGRLDRLPPGDRPVDNREAPAAKG